MRVSARLNANQWHSILEVLDPHYLQLQGFPIDTGTHIIGYPLALCQNKVGQNQIGQPFKGGFDMKRLSVLLSWISVALLMVVFAAGKALAQAGDLVVHTATVDLTHLTGTEPVDQIDMTATFTNNELVESKRCEANTDSLLLHGVKVSVQQGLFGAATRKSNMTIPFFVPLIPGSSVATFGGFTAEGAHCRCGLADTEKTARYLWLLLAAR